MSEIITIASVEDRTSKNGRAYRLVKNAQDQAWFVFDTALFPMLAPNATIEVEAQLGNDGKSKNITAVTRTLPTPNGATRVTATEHEADKDEQIRRQVALKAAVELAQAWQLTTTEAVVTTAAVFLAWLRDPTADDTPF